MRIENSFIPVEGVGETTERRLWERGVTTWDDFDPAVDVPGMGATTTDRIESFIAEALARLDDGDSAYFDRTFPSGERWRLYENFREETCFFDIETTGLDERRDRVTTVSFHQGGETTTLVAGDDLTARRLREQFADASLLATFNGARFDVPFLETSFDVEIDTPHLDLMYPAKRIGLSGGLKPIEKQLGIERDRPDISGRDAVRLWREYERGDEAALETLVSYNREDTVNLRTLADAVCGRLDDEVFVAAPDGDGD
ncbi:exonuclease [Halorubrum sp. GN11_10-6_MGM]|uniref:ribonuclease H-like domain-containing protein n=1 Tax=Halorubrum sp. GN11_10-6_MGM TaxID=2518112 RepID=UPI0010F74F61|nr:ribonuclease H-like domain-containing protein [Halorubrum sp. GN11_10-6_MGM]TKX74767.1 exonuclease [Halorubrum sp. GN11_10-6_MGM]